MADDADVDIVYVATIHPTHHALAKMALNAGKHVLVEKPFTMNQREAVELVDLAAEKRLFLMEAMCVCDDCTTHTAVVNASMGAVCDPQVDTISPCYY
eukprot:COSAG02_NODE_23668_length_711_cov_1.372549_2_plen_98_part_00